jgi:uncharacterized protein (TIGR02246 family)
MRTGLLFALLIAWSDFALSSEFNYDDENDIRDVFAGLTEAWRNGDGEAWGTHFADDADFTVWFGLELKGREAIASGHQYIFDGVYADSAFEMEIRQLRKIGSDVAVAHLRGYVVKNGQERSGKPDAVPVAVLQQIDGDWKIVTFHNTAYVVDEIGESIPLAEFRQLLNNVRNDP